MSKPMDDVCLARLPRTALAALAPLRCHRGVTVTADGDAVWLRWPAGDETVLACVLPVGGVELFVRERDTWHRFGCRLPVFDVGPIGEGQPLANVLFPAPIQPASPSTRPLAPVTLTLRRDDQPRPTTGWLGPPGALEAFANRAPTADLEAILAGQSRGRVLLLGTSLPALPGGQRSWGRGVLVPLGWRPDPDLPEGVLREAFGLDRGDYLMLDHAGAEIVPGDALRPLSRTAVRLLLSEAT